MNRKADGRLDTMTDFKVKIGAKEAVLDVQVIVLPLLNQKKERFSIVFVTILLHNSPAVPNLESNQSRRGLNVNNPV